MTLAVLRLFGASYESKVASLKKFFVELTTNKNFLGLGNRFRPRCQNNWLSNSNNMIVKTSE